MSKKQLTREEIRARTLRRVAEGMTPEEREEYGKLVASKGSTQVSFTKSEMILFLFQLRMLYGVTVAETQYASMQAAVELTVTNKVGKEEFLATLGGMYDSFEVDFREKSAEAVEVATELAVGTQEAVRGLIEKYASKKKSSQGEKSSHGFDVPEGEAILIPNDWDKTVN